MKALFSISGVNFEMQKFSIKKSRKKNNGKAGVFLLITVIFYLFISERFVSESILHNLFAVTFLLTLDRSEWENHQQMHKVC